MPLPSLSKASDQALARVVAGDISFLLEVGRAIQALRFVPVVFVPGVSTLLTWMKLGLTKPDPCPTAATTQTVGGPGTRGLVKVPKTEFSTTTEIGSDEGIAARTDDPAPNELR